MFLSLIFFSIVLVMCCLKLEVIVFLRIVRLLFIFFYIVLLGYLMERYIFVLVIDCFEILCGVFGVEDDIGYNCIGLIIFDDCI